MKKRTEIVIVLDRSGSMSSIWNETMEGFNSFLSEQQEKNPDALISLIQFDHNYYPNYESIPIKEAKYLNKDTYTPTGLTALLDAIGRTISKTRKRHSELSKEERPEKVLFVIITDGYENNSTEYSREVIFNNISEMEKLYNWEFVYLGANQDAIAEASRFGITDKKAMTFAHDSLGMKDAFNSLSSLTANYCMTDTAFEFSEEDRKKQERKKKERRSWINRLMS